MGGKNCLRESRHSVRQPGRTDVAKLECHLLPDAAGILVQQERKVASGTKALMTRTSKKGGTTGAKQSRLESSRAGCSVWRARKKKGGA